MVVALPVAGTAIAIAVEEGEAYPLPEVNATPVTGSSGVGAAVVAPRCNTFGMRCILTVIAATKLGVARTVVCLRLSPLTV